MNTIPADSAAMYAELFEKAPQALIIIDRTLTIKQHNIAGAKLLAQAGFKGEKSLSFLTGLERAVDDAMGIGEWVPFHSQIGVAAKVTLDGKVRRLRSPDVNDTLAVALQQNGQGRVALRRLTEEVEKVERQRSQLYVDKLKHEFISVVSHELRTPLTSILGALGLARSGRLGDVPHQIQGLLDMAHSNGDRLLELINDILDFEKFQSGNFDFNMTARSVHQLLEKARQDAEGIALKDKITLALDLAGDDALINVDEKRFEQIMANLLSNAVKFSPAGSQVTFTCRREAAHVRVGVMDQGPGIEPDFQGHIFEKFTQANSAATRSQGGTGLGLSISRSIVEEFGGTLNFKTHIGKGTEFYFTLSVAADSCNKTGRARAIVTA